MSKTNIKIDRLQVRLKGVSPQSARNAADGLARELADRLAPHAMESANVGDVNAGTSRIASGTGPTELRTQIATKIASSIASKLR